MIDKDGKLGFPASVEDIRRFGAQARKVFFLRKPPSQLQQSFAQVVMNRGNDRPPDRPWKRRGDQVRGGIQDRLQEERVERAKRQHG
jgi:hypothetical protein